MSTSSTWGLTREALSRLLAIGTEGDGQPSDEQVSHALRHRLSSTAVAHAHAPLSGDRPESGGPAPPSLHQMLLDRSTPVATFEAIKDRAKVSSRTGSSGLEKAVEVTVYHAAIAAALVHHDVKISRHRNDHLERSFRTLLDKPWMDPQLSSLFERARRTCHG